MRMVDLIEKKRNGHELNKAEIDFIIEGYTKGDLPDYQLSAFAMAIYGGFPPLAGSTYATGLR